MIIHVFCFYRVSVYRFNCVVWHVPSGIKYTTTSKPRPADTKTDFYAHTDQVRSAFKFHLSAILLSLFWTETRNCRLQVEKVSEEAAWFDVGVFKTLFSEVSHYFLPADSDQVSTAISSRLPNTKEVKNIQKGHFKVVWIIIIVSLTNLPSYLSSEEDPRTSGLSGQGKAGASSGANLQVQSCRHQLFWPGWLQPCERVQDLPARFPRSALCCQNHQGDIN